MGLVESLPSVSFENDAEVHWYYYLANGFGVQLRAKRVRCNAWLARTIIAKTWSPKKETRERLEFIFGSTKGNYNEDLIDSKKPKQDAWEKESLKGKKYP